jgi:hypothetical protein
MCIIYIEYYQQWLGCGLCGKEELMGAVKSLSVHAARLRRVLVDSTQRHIRRA